MIPNEINETNIFLRIEPVYFQASPTNRNVVKFKLVEGLITSQHKVLDSYVVIESVSIAGLTDVLNNYIKNVVKNNDFTVKTYRKSVNEIVAMFYPTPQFKEKIGNLCTSRLKS